MKIGFCYNVKSRHPPKFGTELDYDAPETITGISRAIAANGYEVIRVKADVNAFEKLRRIRRKIGLVFNIAEGTTGDARESQIPIFCEMLGIPYTHSTPTTHAVSLDKNLTKLAVAGLGVRVPGSVLFSDCEAATFRGIKLDFPLIIKPNREGSSSGVFSENVVDDEKSLKRRMEEIKKKCKHEELLAEEFIDGREFTVAVWGNAEPEVLPIIEQKFDFLPKHMHRIAGYELKWMYEDKLKDLTRAYSCPAGLNRRQKGEIERVSKLVYRGLGVREAARIDYRMNKAGKLFFIEINTLPGIIPDEGVISYFPLAARAAGYSYKQMIGKIIDMAKKRYGI